MDAPVLDPAGPAAASIEGLWWLMFWLGLAVYVAVLALLVVPMHRRRRQAAEDDGAADDSRVSRALILGGGVVVPVVVLLVLVVTTGMVTAGVPWNSDPPDESLRVEVVGHMFWWEVRYPESRFETANQIVIPVGEPVHLEMTSRDVIHSFWVPALHGKIDLTPGHTTTLTIEASRAGLYEGRCAEFCGLAHAHMGLSVDARDRVDFDRWLAEQAAPAPEPNTAGLRAGREVFTSSSCVYCHTVRGHTVISDVGPDLTHLASRPRLAADAIPNTRGYLAGWILDPHSAKPGNRMPATNISGRELQMLLDYLENLE